MAFMAQYVAYTGLMLVVTRAGGGRWTGATAKLNLLAMCALGAMTANAFLNPEPISRWAIGLSLLSAATALCMAQLMRRSGLTLARLLARVGGA
jgi:hypothetical protein